MDNREETAAVYERLLKGKAKALSSFFFEPSHMKERLRILVRYITEEKLGMTPEEALTGLTEEKLAEYKAKSILKYIPCPPEYGNGNLAYVVYFAYPELPAPSCSDLAVSVYKEVLGGKRRSFPKSYFAGADDGKERAVACFRYLCGEVLGKNDGDGGRSTAAAMDAGKCSAVLTEYKLHIILGTVFASATELLEAAYPGIFQNGSIPKGENK